MPDWGRAIFSPLCIIVRPEGGEELGRFLKYALALTQLHVQVGGCMGGGGGAQGLKVLVGPDPCMCRWGERVVGVVAGAGVAVV